ncbi:MAG: rhodanese-like domain-containing protein [Bacillota bacterium]
MVKPGQATNFIFPYAMHPGMGGKHHFEVHLRTNDPNQPTTVFHIYANSVEPGPGGEGGAAESPSPAAGGYYEWSPSGLRAAMQRKDFTLVNVHIPFEGRIPGTDLEIPYDQIAGALDQLPPAKDAPIVLYCRSGRMSEIAARQLANLGYSRVIHLRGGMVAWEELGYPLQQ